MLGEAERGEIMARLPEMFAGRTREQVTGRGRRGRRARHPGAHARRGAERRARRRPRAPSPTCPSPGAPARCFAGLYGVDGAAGPVPRPGRRGRGAELARPSGAVRARHRPTPGPSPGCASSSSATASPRRRPVGCSAEWGAEVIKVESRRRPDFQRMVMGGEMNPAFSTVARGKLAFGADLSTEAGRDLVAVAAPVGRHRRGEQRHRRHRPPRLRAGTSCTPPTPASSWSAPSSTATAAPGRPARATARVPGPSAGSRGCGPTAPTAPRGVMTIHPDHLAGRMVALAALSGVRSMRRTGSGVPRRPRPVRGGGVPPRRPAGGREPRARCGGAHRQHRRRARALGPVPLRRRRRLRELAVGVRHRRRRLGRAGRASPGERCPTTPRGAPRPVVWPTRRRSRPRWRPGSPTATPRRSRTPSRPPGWPPAWPCTLDSRSSTRPSPGGATRSAIDQPGSGPIILEGPAFTGSRMGSPDCRPAPRPFATHRADLS